MILRNITISLAILFFLTLAVYMVFISSLNPVSDSQKTQQFVVKRGATLTTIAKDLEKQGLIRSRLSFFIIAKQMGIEKKLQAGSYRLSPSLTTREIAEKLTQGTEDVWVTVKEGLRSEEVADIFLKELGIPTREFLVAARSQEGYLFPDTYLFPKEASAQAVVSLMRKTFDKRFTSQMQEQARVNNGLSPKEVVVLASIVQREGVVLKDGSTDFNLIANILVKRLKADWPLEVDATLQYIVANEAREGQKEWWTQNLTNEDKKIKSPYNTYLNKGLPPAPIANPGLAALKAVIEATGDTPYFFYIHKDRQVYPAKTLEEHNANIEKYLR